MNSKILIITSIIVLIIVAGIGFLSIQNKTKTVTVTKNQINNTPKESVPTSVTVSVTSQGFKPSELKIKKGTLVIWNNESANSVTVNSDNHPAHLLWPFLNLGTFKNGESVSVVFDKVGNYTYHNHFNPTQRGKVMVE